MKHGYRHVTTPSALFTVEGGYYLNFLSMQLFRKSRQTLVFNEFKTCLKNSNTSVH